MHVHRGSFSRIMWHDSSVSNLIHGFVLFFFQIIVESARFRVLRKTSSHLTPGGGIFGRAGQPPGSENFYPTHPPLKLKITRVTFTENILPGSANWKRMFRSKQTQTNEICLICFRKFRSQSQRTSEHANAEERERSVQEGSGTPPVS